jgi:putative membrane protein
VKLVHRHIGFLYALKKRLRDAGEDNYKKYLAPGDEERMGEQTHIPNAILLLQGQDIEGAVASQYTDVFRMTQINEMLNGFSDHMGKCERIKNTPFPVAYTTLIRTSIWLFAIVFPASITGVVGYWAIPFGWLLAAIFVLTRAMGEQLMNPFERTMSGTAMSSITRTIEINLLEQLGAEDIPKAVEPIDNLYVL